MNEKHGGPAFPYTELSIDRYGDIDNCNTSEGMTLRDWFAGMALQGTLADSELTGDHETFAYDAYKFADAMMKAREA